MIQNTVRDMTELNRCMVAKKRPGSPEEHRVLSVQRQQAGQVYENRTEQLEWKLRVD